jgi:hypothetical protein
MKNYKKLILCFIVLLVFMGNSFGDSLSLYTETSFGDADFDDNWDWWQQDSNYPDPCYVTDRTEDALYFCAYDGASGHTNDDPCWPVDGNINGVYSTFTMGEGGAPVFQSLNISGVDINEPDRFEQRDTRVMVLVNTAKIKAVNENAGAVLDCKFRWSIDYVMRWVGGSTYLDAPSTMYVSVFGCDQQGFWRHPPDDTCNPNTPVEHLQDIFDEEPSTEKACDLRVADGPGTQDVNGLRRLTNWTVEIYGVQFYEMDFTKEVREVLANDPNLEWICFTMRPSRDGESVNLSVDATLRQDQNPIPPTVDIKVAKYLGDMDDDETVDFNDLDLFTQQWLRDDDSFIADLNVDGNVDFRDFAIFGENWLKKEQ